MKPSPERRAKLRNMRRVAQRVAQTRANRRNFALWAMRDARANDWSEEFLADVIVASMTPSRSRFGIYGPCFYCGDWLANGVDHLNPRSRGGGDNPGNLVSACWPCNYEKRDRTASEYYEYRERRAVLATTPPPEPPPLPPFPADLAAKIRSLPDSPPLIRANSVVTADSVRITLVRFGLPFINEGRAVWLSVAAMKRRVAEIDAEGSP
jgi:5-methylcytosine-specific restriction endonuclease McrA